MIWATCFTSVLALRRLDFLETRVKIPYNNCQYNITNIHSGHPCSVSLDPVGSK